MPNGKVFVDEKKKRNICIFVISGWTNDSMVNVAMRLVNEIVFGIE